GLIECLHGLPIRVSQVFENVVPVTIRLAGRAGLEPEVKNARARYGHLGDGARVRLQEFEMLDHRLAGKAELPDDPDALRLGLHALELDAVVELVELDAVQHGEEVEMPPRAAEFAVGRKLQSNLRLLLDQVPDLAILDLLELSRRDLALFAPGPGLLE